MPVPEGHWEMPTFVGVMHGGALLACVEQILVATLKRRNFAASGYDGARSVNALTRRVVRRPVVERL